MNCYFSYREEILKFLKAKHGKIAGGYTFSADISFDMNARNSDISKLCIYSCDSGAEEIVLVCKGRNRDKIVYCQGDNEVILFDELTAFAKYLELCERKNRSEDGFITFAKSQICHDSESADGNNQIVNEKADNLETIEIDSDMSGFIHDNDRITITEEDFEQMRIPDKIIIDDKVIEAENINLEIIRTVQQHLYSGDYGRIEVTNFGYMVHKKRRYLSHEDSLVFQCENGKAFMCYFDGKNLNTNIFYDNRNDAGSLPSELVPTVIFRGRKQSEQHILYDRSKLVKVLLELLFTGSVSYEKNVSTMDKGFFSTLYFSNKNAYLRSKNEIGEFNYELF